MPGTELLQSMKQGFDFQLCSMLTQGARLCKSGRKPAAVFRCQAQAAASSSTAVQPTVNPLLMGLVQAIFKNQTLYGMAQKQAKQMIKKRAEQIGIDWDGAMQEFKTQDWNAMMREVVNPAVKMPAYYQVPFHAYPEGNLTWDAAHEVTMAAKSVHAYVMDPTSKNLDAEGDEKMRASFNQRTRECMEDLGASPSAVRDIVDLGCASGLSSTALLAAFPESSITGVDLSPHFLTMALYEQRKRQAAGGAKEPLTFIHGLAEDTGLPAGCADLVSICLVCHELPAAASKAVFREAYRLLRPGGCFAVMEVDPQSPTVMKMLSNPFSYTAFKSTEPYLEEYLALDMHGALKEAGFAATTQKACTTRHRTVVAVKQ